MAFSYPIKANLHKWMFLKVAVRVLINSRENPQLFEKEFSIDNNSIWLIQKSQINENDKLEWRTVINTLFKIRQYLRNLNEKKLSFSNKYRCAFISIDPNDILKKCKIINHSEKSLFSAVSKNYLCKHLFRVFFITGALTFPC